MLFLSVWLYCIVWSQVVLWLIPLGMHFYLRMTLVVLDLLCSHINFMIFSSSSVKNIFGYFSKDFIDCINCFLWYDHFKNIYFACLLVCTVFPLSSVFYEVLYVFYYRELYHIWLSLWLSSVFFIFSLLKMEFSWLLIKQFHFKHVCIQKLLVLASSHFDEEVC